MSNFPKTRKPTSKKNCNLWFLTCCGWARCHGRSWTQGIALYLRFWPEPSHPAPKRSGHRIFPSGWRGGGTRWLRKAAPFRTDGCPRSRSWTRRRCSCWLFRFIATFNRNPRNDSPPPTLTDWRATLLLPALKKSKLSRKILEREGRDAGWGGERFRATGKGCEVMSRCSGVGWEDDNSFVHRTEGVTWHDVHKKTI